MSNLLTGTFLLLHGLLHGWFVILAMDWIKLKSDMGWTGDSWLLSDLFNPTMLKYMALILYSLSGLLFLTGAVGV